MPTLDTRDIDTDLVDAIARTTRPVLSTRYHGPTDTLGARVSVRWLDAPDRAPVGVAHYDHARGGGANHHAAALAYIARYAPGAVITAAGWTTTGYVYAVWLGSAGRTWKEG